MGTQQKLTSSEMRELLDRHMRCELEADLDGLMDTLAEEVVWGRDDDPAKLVGKAAVYAHYEGILAPGKHDAERLRGWYDEENQSSATEYTVTVNLDNGQSISFPVLACVDFIDGRMKNETLFFSEGRQPSKLLPQDELEKQGDAFMKAMLLSEAE